ncbi:MAG: leucyl aminopeptidase [Pseudomonadota bacterium]
MQYKALLTSCAAIALMTPSVAAAPDFSFTPATAPAEGDVVIYVSPDTDLTGVAAEIDSATGNRISAALAATEFSADFGEALSLVAMTPFDTVSVIGIGEDELTPRALQDLGGHAAKVADDEGGLALIVETISATQNDASAFIAMGYALGDYAFTKYKSSADEEEGPSNVLLIGGEAGAALYNDDLAFVVEGVELAREFGNEPGNVVYPEVFVQRAREAFRGVPNVRLRTLEARDIRNEGMGALMGVGQGSIHDPRMLIVEYTGAADRDEAPIGLVGKGVTFDTGGISIKPSSNMWYMKSDLSGAAAVAGTLLATAKRGEEVNVVGLMPLAENMPSQDAIRPGDVLTTMSGKTVEVMNTDAEGRLLLIDALHYVQENYEPSKVLNIATLTGSAARAMGDDYGAVITRELDLSLEMVEIGEASGEDVWPLPLHPSHADQLKSPIADLRNTGGQPGASTAAAFVGSFVDEDLPWIHLDIAGVDWRDSATPTQPKGHAGWGVRFMDEFLRRESE